MLLPGRLEPAVDFWTDQADQAVDMFCKWTCIRIPAVWFYDLGLPTTENKKSLYPGMENHVKLHCSRPPLPMCLLSPLSCVDAFLES